MVGNRRCQVGHSAERSVRVDRHIDSPVPNEDRPTAGHVGQSCRNAWYILARLHSDLNLEHAASQRKYLTSTF